MEHNLEFATYLISYYNHMAHCQLKVSNKSNLDKVYDCADRVGGDYSAIKQHIKQWISEHEFEGNFSSRFKECLDAFMPAAPKAGSETTSKKTSKTVDKSVAESLNILEKAVADIIVKTQSEKIEEAIMGNVQNEVRDFIRSEYGTIERKITTVVDGKKHELTGLLHEKFDTVFKFVSQNEPVFLSGPAGSGKNYICKQVAQALGLKFYFSNAVTQEYKITGFTDAMGKYQPTQFFKAFTEGGLFMLDEIDASIPEVLVILNAAIANRYFDFPAPIGYREAHPDFRVVAAGNTTGHGADYDYVGRNQLDAASLDRFALVDIDYSPTIENGLSTDQKLIDFCREFREAGKKVGSRIIVSYRAIERLDNMVQIMDLEEALKTCLIKDLEKDDLNIILKELKSSKYKEAVNSICQKMHG